MVVNRGGMAFVGAGLEIKDLPILSKSALSHWVSLHMRRQAPLGVVHLNCKTSIAINQQQKKETEIRTTEIQTMETMPKDLLIIKFKHHNPALTQLVKTKLKGTVSKTVIPARYC